MQRHALDVEPREQLRREVQPGRRRGGRALLRPRRPSGSAPASASGSWMYGGSGASPVRLAVAGAARQRPSPSVLQQLDRPEPAARPAAAASAARAPPTPSPSSRSTSSTSPPPARSIADPRRHDARVVDDDERRPPQLLGQLAEAAVPDVARRALVDEQPRLVAPLGRMLRDQLRRQLVVELGGVHPTATLASCPWTTTRSNEPRSASRDAQPDGADAGRGRGRARAGADPDRGARQRPPTSSRARCPSRSAPRCATGVRAEALPVARQLAEVRGLLNQVIRRLERLEGDAARRAPRARRRPRAARRPRLSGWQGVDQRLAASRTARPAAARSSPDRERRPPTATAKPAEHGALGAGSTSSKRLPLPTSLSQLDPAAERDRQLARDREPEPRAARRRVDQNGPEDPLALLRPRSRARCRRRRP